MPVERIPLQWDIDYRSIGVTTSPAFGPNGKDAYNHNVMYEQTDAGLCTRQRPGTVIGVTTGVTGTPQGCVRYHNQNYIVVNDTFRHANGSLILTGTNGTSFSTASSGNPWKGRINMQVVSLNNLLYMIGGFTLLGAGAQGDVWMSQDGGVTWGLVTGSAPFGARMGHKVLVFNGKMYLIGGYYQTYSVAMNDVWVSSDGANWTQLTQSAPWAGRAYFAGVSTDGGLYIMGGTTTSFPFTLAGTCYNDVWFSADGVNWTQITAAAAWSVRCSFDCIQYNGQFVILGGINTATLGLNNECWASSDARNWAMTTGAALSVGANAGTRLLVYAGKMWALGPGTGVGAVNGNPQVYGGTNTPAAWLPFASPLTGGRTQGAAVVAGAPAPNTGLQTMFYIGGQDNGANELDSVVYGAINAGISSFALSPAVANQPYQFQEFNYGNSLLIKNQSNLWVYEAGTVTKVVDPRYPATTVPGIVALGGFVYVMDPTGLIVNCDFNRPLYWPGQNYVGADYEPDGGIAIEKYLNYLVAFGSRSIQMFYDAGTPVGSPLLPYLPGNQEFGCRDGLTVKAIGGNIYWYGVDQNKYSGVATFNGLKAQIVSPQQWMKLLNYAYDTNNLWNALTVSTSSHQFYVIPLNANADLPAGMGSLVYHINANRWYLWQAGDYADPAGTSAYAFQSSCTSPDANPGVSNTLMLTADGRYLVYPNENLGYDVTNTGDTSISQAFVRSPPIDFGNHRMKFWGRQDLICDVVPIDGVVQDIAPVMTMTVKDDDSNVSTGLKTIDVSGIRPATFQWGASRRRSFQLNWGNVLPVCRVWAIEQEFEQGT